MLLLFCALSAPIPAAESQANHSTSVIVNGGFEGGMGPWWGTSGEVVKDAAAEGAAALKLDGGYVVQDKRPVQAGQRYRISMQIKSQGSPEGAVFVQLSYRGAGVDPGWRGPQLVNFDSNAEPALFVTGGTHGWKSFSVVVQAPAYADQAVLYLRKKNGSAGSAFYDAVEMSATEDPVVEPTELKRKQRLAELLQTDSSVPANKAKLGLDRMVQDAHESTQALSSSSSKTSSPPLLLVENGRARYRIHVATNTDLITLSAAAELAESIRHISGAQMVPFSHDANPQAGPLLVIGRENVLTNRLCPDIAYEKLGADGFAICTAGTNLVIAGATPRGTMYGVNWLIDRKLGVKWLSPSYTHWPDRKTLSIAAVNETQVPRFSYREILSYEGQDKIYRAHNLLNGESHGPSFWTSPDTIDSWDHSWMAKGGDATFLQLLPPAQFGKEHPEWYSGGQVAMMNPALREAMAAAVVNRLKQLPDYKSVWFDIHDLDWGWDMDPASQAFADQHGGSPSAPRLDMMIDIAARVRAVLPGAKFAFNAYHWSFTPPTGMTVPDYILVFPMTIQVDYSSALNRGPNEKMGRDIAGWNGIAKNILVWDHITNFSGYIQPTPNIYPIGASIQWLATLSNVQGYFAEGSWNTPAAEFASLRVWMMARLLWNPAEDVHALVAEYCRDYYGPAGDSILRYIDLMHAEIAKSGDMLSEKTQVDAAMLNLDFLRSADQMFEAAEKAVSHDPVLLAHVHEARLPIDYVALVRRQEYADEAASRHIPWEADTTRRLDRFNRAVKEAKLYQYRQGGNLDELAVLLAVERHRAEPPDMVRSLARSQWVDYQDLSLNRYDGADIVQDTAASDGAAARMIGNSPSWAIQFKLDKLPRVGRWEIYASVRVDALPGHDKDIGAHVGSYPPMGRYERIPVGLLNDGRYHWIKVPGGAFKRDPDQGKGIFLQAPNNGAVKYVYVDRLLAVRIDER